MSNFYYLVNANDVFRFPDQGYICDLCTKGCDVDTGVTINNGCMNMSTNDCLFALVDSNGIKCSKALTHNEAIQMFKDNNNIIIRSDYLKERS